MENYVSSSLELHLFFLRIMREHALFLQAGFLCKDVKWSDKADWYRQKFEELLAETVSISDRMVSEEVLFSGEIVTEFTVRAEKETQRLSGVPIDSRISVAEQCLQPGCGDDERVHFCRVQQLNERALELLKGLIGFKEDILCAVKDNMLFTTNYPLLIEHITREAKLYCDLLEQLVRTGRLEPVCQRETEQFWNQIMKEHALFIRGLLDPTEEALIDTAGNFAEDYEKLLEMAKEQDCRVMDDLTGKSLRETLKYREFKEAGTEGILNNEIASLILPLLADHVLREANHYVRILWDSK